ncbi:MAG: 30S ribosomal protein S8 [Candidatus Pacebacteria bacterium]|nr:30S ribosomal protein S8 [Candidatus Paceibacterota bacterium]
MDPIADMITKIRNGYAVGKETVAVPFSKFKVEILKVLEDNHYLKDFAKRGKKAKKNLEIVLLYNEDGSPAITAITRVSKQSRRVYRSFREIFSAGAGNGIKILSTPAGVLSDKEARKKKVGGEVICEVR